MRHSSGTLVGWNERKAEAAIAKRSTQHTAAE